MNEGSEDLNSGDVLGVVRSKDHSQNPKQSLEGASEGGRRGAEPPARGGNPSTCSPCASPSAGAPAPSSAQPVPGTTRFTELK